MLSRWMGFTGIEISYAASHGILLICLNSHIAIYLVPDLAHI